MCFFQEIHGVQVGFHEYQRQAGGGALDEAECIATAACTEVHQATLLQVLPSILSTIILFLFFLTLYLVALWYR